MKFEDIHCLHSSGLSKSFTGAKQNPGSGSPRQERGHVRRAASLSDADRLPRSRSLDRTGSPSCIPSEEEQGRRESWRSEVIFHRGHRPSVISESSSEQPSFLSDDLNYDSNENHIQSPSKKPFLSGKAFELESPLKAVSETDISTITTTTNETQQSPSTVKKLPPAHREIKKYHRRNRSLDVNIKFGSTEESERRMETKLSESQDYDIISDSELTVSLESRENEEFLVVDDCLKPNLETFVPSEKEENSRDKLNILYYLKLGVMLLLEETLLKLPENMVTRVFGKIMKVEHLLVLVNQKNDKLREVALRVSDYCCFYL